ncbi:MAG: hypothetical protein HY438_01850 [DPANN group archaeon]|nr:hypothetical protein [DPANN group archaeon]
MRGVDIPVAGPDGRRPGSSFHVEAPPISAPQPQLPQQTQAPQVQQIPAPQPHGPPPVRQAAQAKLDVSEQIECNIPPPVLGDFPVIGSKLALGKRIGKMFMGVGAAYAAIFIPLVYVLETPIVMFVPSYIFGLGAAVYFSTPRRISKINNMLNNSGLQGTANLWRYCASRSLHNKQKDVLAQTLEQYLQNVNYTVLRGKNRVTAIGWTNTIEANFYELPSSKTCLDVLVYGSRTKSALDGLLAKL